MMKNKKYIIVGAVVVVILAVVVLTAQSSKWSQLSFEAVVQETVTQSDGEIRLIVERTTELYGSPINSLCISGATKLLNANGEKVEVCDFQPGDAVSVTLKNAFTEEIPFYYPTVYAIKLSKK